MDIYKKIKEMVELMRDFDLVEIEIKDGEREIKLRKGGKEADNMPQINPMSFQTVPMPAGPAQGATPAPAGETPAEKDPSLYEFKSPMVGSFYRAPSPESPPYATEGDKVNKESILCIVEAMKVMNEIKAEINGEVLEILVENGEAVEFGQPLFLIKLSS